MLKRVLILLFITTLPYIYGSSDDTSDKKHIANAASVKSASSTSTSSSTPAPTKRLTPEEIKAARERGRQKAQAGAALLGVAIKAILPETEAEKTIKKMKEELENIKMPDVGIIVEDMEREQEHAAMMDDDRLDESLKKQNTIVGEKQLYSYDEDSYEFPTKKGYVRDKLTGQYEYKTLETVKFTFAKGSVSLGIYKRDLIEGPIFFANFFADYFLYKKLKKLRIERIFEDLKKNNEEFEDVLVTTFFAADGYVETHKNLGFFSRLFTNYFAQNSEINKPLNDYYTKHFLSASLNPFNSGTIFRRQTIIPLIMRFGLEKISEYIEERAITKLKYNNYVWPKWLVGEESYDRDKKGVYLSRGENNDQFEKETYSILNIVRYILDSRSWSRMYFTDVYQGPPPLYYLNEYAKLGIPDWFFGAKFQKSCYLANQVSSLFFSAKFLDEFYQARWIDYINKNNGELMDLLSKYRKAKKNLANGVADAEKIKISIENQIKAFIEKAHELNSRWPTTGINEWLQFKAYGLGTASYYTSMPLTLPVTLYVGWKLLTNGRKLFSKIS